MAKMFVNHNWDVFVSELSKELGFISEAAQAYVKKCSDHHKTMSILKVAHLVLRHAVALHVVLSYQCLTSFDWVMSVGWKDLNYRYTFNVTWTYLMTIQLLHVGVRRNNTGSILPVN
ncbi:hypothetical protein ACROYT_G015610 [Oculina patagonica]